MVDSPLCPTPPPIHLSLNNNDNPHTRAGIVGVGDVKQVIVEDKPSLLFPPYIPRYPERIRENGGDIFAAIRAKDILVGFFYTRIAVNYTFFYARTSIGVK